jgi:hypothetical protein
MVDSLEFATWEVTFDRVVIRFFGKEDDDVGLQHFEFCPKRGMPSHDVAEFSHGGRLRWSQQSKLLQRKPNRGDAKSAEARVHPARMAFFYSLLLKRSLDTPSALTQRLDTSRVREDGNTIHGFLFRQLITLALILGIQWRAP